MSCNKPALTGLRDWTKSYLVETGLDKDGQKDKFKVFQWFVSCIYSPCRDGSNYYKTWEKAYIKAFFTHFPQPNKLQPQQGVWPTPLYWTKELSIITGGHEGGQNSKQDTMRFLRLPPTLSLTHTYRKNAWLINAEKTYDIKLMIWNKEK